ncbi:MAG: DUF1641 domain-containing protein [Candidatus Electrothrix sp. GM3_4]|nr:DUF1641 domain-containing protein [Candidatus Electrothrix sp. GM3_4]
MGNIAEVMKTLNSMMDMKRDVELLSGPIVDDLIERLEGFKQRGLFDDFQRMLDIGEQVSLKMKQVDLAGAKPITGIFGMISALKRREVQEGLGVLIELSTVASALKYMPKEEPTKDCASSAT